MLIGISLFGCHLSSLHPISLTPLVVATQAKRQAEEAEKKKASEAKAVREAAKKLVKKERQRLRAINEGGGEFLMKDMYSSSSGSY